MEGMGGQLFDLALVLSTLFAHFPQYNGTHQQLKLEGRSSLALYCNTQTLRITIHAVVSVE